jgi:protein TonB
MMTSMKKGKVAGFRNTLLAVMVTASAVMSPVFIASASAVESAKDNTVSVIKRALPKYPKYAVKNGIEGAVLINFSIEGDGNVSDIEVVASDQDGLFDATAILGVQKWVYTKPNHKIRNNYVAIEFALTDSPKASQFSNVEKIQVRGE